MLLIVAVGLAPAVHALERHPWPRWRAAGTIELLIAAALIGFLALTWSSLAYQAESLRSQVDSFQQQLTQWLPLSVVDAMWRAGRDSAPHSRDTRHRRDACC